MSHITYDREWKKAQEDLTSTLQLEPTQADRRQQRKLLATLYVKYILVANKLAECVDQMVQPQKRALIRKLLDATLGRILELKADLVEADLNEWTHVGDIIDILKVTPLQSELKVPTCYRYERKEELDYRRGVVNNVLGKLGFLDKTEQKVPMSEKEAILIIQVHERARQGRLRAQFMREIRGMKEKGKPIGEVEDEEEAGGLSLSAALRIQKVWRGYMTRRATRRRKLQEMLLIGMIPPPKTRSVEIQKAREIEESRRELQKKRQKEYEEAKVSCKENLEKHQRGAVLEQLSDQVRSSLHEYKAQTGKIPEYTGSERSTSRLMLSRQGTDSELSKSTSSKESKSKKGRSSKSKDSKSQEEEEDDAASRAIVSVFLPELNTRKEEYDEMWRDRDESGNPQQYHYTDIIQQEQMTIMENELRKIVDDMMRSELQLLQDAFDRDRGHKGKKQKASKKSRRGAKKSKKKKEKDLTPDRTTESLFEELVANGIIKQCPEKYLDDFIGEKSYNEPILYNQEGEPPIALGDLRQILTEYCIVPLLTQNLHQSTPHIKSLLLTGPKGSGKDLLVHAICTEAGATLFDLTPANIVGKYPGKMGLIMLMHLVSKVSKLLQPSIIYMDCAERPFVKKIPKTDKTDPKRLKKDLPKLIKNLYPEDRVMLIGVSSCPWESDQKLLQQVYQKFLVVPKPDYSSRFRLWSHLLGQYSAISWQFDTSSITKLSDGFTAGTIAAAFNEVLTVKRMVQLRVHPLSPLELINALAKRVPIYREEEEAYEIWWSKTPMYRRKMKAIEMMLEEQFEQEAKQANAKTKKKKTPE